MNGGFLGYYKLMGQVAEVLTLDTYPTTVPVFYLNKKIKTGFTGDICLVEEMTGNTTQAFQFNADGTFPTAALETFASSGDARLRRWYDANGSTRYIDFGTGTQQPLIVESGTSTTLAGQISPKFTGAQYGTLASSTSDYDFLHNGNVVGTTLIIGATTSTTERQAFISTADGSSRFGFGLFCWNNNRIRVTAQSSADNLAFMLETTNSFPNNTKVDYFTKWDVANATAIDRLTVDLNGTGYASNTLTATAAAAPATSDLTMGRGASAGTRYVEGQITGFIAWAADNYVNRADILATL